LAKQKKEKHFFSYTKSVMKATTQSIKRNSLMSFASVISVVAALLILGLFLIFTLNLQYITEHIEDALQLKVFMTEEFNPDDAQTVITEFEKNENVAAVSFESKDVALENFSESLDDYSGLLEGYDANNNPLNDAFIVQVKDPAQMMQLKEDLEARTDLKVSYVKYGEEYVDALMSFSHFSNVFSGVVMIVLSIISFFIIYNTIKLTCFARRREIRIMKYIGASNWYVRTPFILEGTFLGVAGSAAAVLIIRTIYYYGVVYVNNSVYIPMNSSLMPPNEVMLPVFIFFLVYGVLIGVFGSIFSIRKYLEV